MSEFAPPSTDLGQTLTDRTSAAIRDVLAGKRRGIRSAFLFAGPAVVASIAYVDPGNFATNIQAGSKFGYALLWVVVMANLIAMLFQALSAKLGIVTGVNLAEMCRSQFPPPVRYAMWAASEVAAMATDLAEFLGVPWEAVHAEADRLEHHISEELEDRIADRLGQHAVASPADTSRLDQARALFGLANTLDKAYLLRRIRDDGGDPALLGLI